MSESLFKLQLKTLFERNGWITWTERRPIDSNLRVDLIVFKKEYGFVGFELKEINMRQGGVLADAFDHIQEKRKLKFFDGTEIKLWAMGVHFLSKDIAAVATCDIFAQAFFAHFGIGWLSTETINFCVGRSWAVIPISQKPPLNVDVDISRLTKFVKKGKSDE